MHALGALGVRLEGFAPDAIEMRMGVSGRRIFRIDLKDIAEARWGAPYLHVHRADLVAALYERARAVGVTVSFAQRYQGEEADLVVGADGLHSDLRARLHGADKPRFTGSVAWRALVPVAALSQAPPKTACAWAGDGRHCVTYYLRQGSLVNFVGVVEEAESGAESWSAEGLQSDLAERFDCWNPVIDGLIRAAQNVRRWSLYDRAPLPFWQKDHKVLIGDAAHPMLPSLAQGAVMALEDAVALAHYAEQADGLAQFYAARIDRVSRVQRQAAENLKLFHQSGMVSKLRHYGPLWAGSRVLPREAHRRLDWLYGYQGPT